MIVIKKPNVPTHSAHTIAIVDEVLWVMDELRVNERAMSNVLMAFAPVSRITNAFAI